MADTVALPCNPAITSLGSKVAKAVYVTSMEAASGKSMISLGLMEAFSRHSSRVGYFRPVVASRQDADNTIELIRRRYDLAQSYEQSYGITTARTRGVGSLRDADGLISEIMGKFDSLAAQCDVVLVEGTDYTGASAAFEFELNVTMALNLAAPVLMVPQRPSPPARPGPRGVERRPAVPCATTR